MNKELVRSNEELVSLHQAKNKLLETTAKLEQKIRDLEQEQIKEMQAHREAMRLVDINIKELELKLAKFRELPKKICDEIKKVAINRDEIELEYDYWVTRYYILEDDIDEIQAKYEKEN